MAANNVRIKAVKMLLDFNADISARSKYGNTALSIVGRGRISYSPEIAAAIRRAAGGWARVRGLVLFLHSGGYAAADWSARRIGLKGIEYNNSHPSSMERSEYNS